LKSQKNLWYHLGLKAISRNNLSHSMRNRSSDIFQNLFYLMFNKTMNISNMHTDKRFKFKMPLKIIDSTTISLCLSLFNWAKFRKKKGGVKLHVLYNAKNQLPEFVDITEAKLNDAKGCDNYPIKPNSIYTGDRAYLSSKFMAKINDKKAFFVIRTKKNTKYEIIKKSKVNKNSGIKLNCIIKFTGSCSKDYPHTLRLIRYYDKEKNKTFDYVTNHFKLASQTIADVYKARWDIELFFKEIKQNLKIKTFIGTSENALKIQIWVALIAYLLIQYVRYKSMTSYTFLTVLRLIRVNLLIHTSLNEVLAEQENPIIKPPPIIEQQLRLAF